MKKIFNTISFKNILIVVLLTLNIGMMLYGVFITKKNTKFLTESVAIIKRKIGSQIVYVQLSEIEKRYLLMKETKKKIERKENICETKLQYLLQNYDSKIAYLQKKRTTMSAIKIEQLEAELSRMKATYDDLKYSQDQELKEEQFSEINKVKKKIQAFLTQYNKSKNYDYIFTDEATFVYYKNPFNDITEDLIKALNKEYLSSKKNN